MDLMIDIETLSTKQNAAIWWIGTAVFDPATDTPPSVAAYRIDAQPLIDAGAAVDWSTVQWWMQQSDAARSGAARDQEPPTAAFQSIANLFSAFDIERVWAKPPQFDIVILEDAYRRMGCRIPWNHRQVRDVRTLFEMSPLAGTQTDFFTEGNVAHNPGYDCVTQVKMVRAALKAIRGG